MAAPESRPPGRCNREPCRLWGTLRPAGNPGPDGIAGGVQRRRGPGLLGKAVGNLLTNAALHSPEGAEVRVTLCRAGDEAVFAVENTGVHLPPETLPHLFEPFYRVDRSRSRRTGGSGLGLYLTETIVRRFGGDCRVENTADGVRAEIRFPSAQNPP